MFRQYVYAWLQLWSAAYRASIVMDGEPAVTGAKSCFVNRIQHGCCKERKGKEFD